MSTKGTGLLAEIAAQSPRKGPACKVGAVEVALEATDRADLRKAFADASITGTAIWRALRGRGHDVDLGAVRRHRAGECQCGRP